MQDELDIISLNDIMEKIRKSELSKIIYGTYLMISDIKIDNTKISQPITIGECYINNIGNYTVKKLRSPDSVNIDTLINDSDYEQHLTTSSTTKTISHSKTTQLSIDLDVGKKFSLNTNILIGELSEETSLTFHIGTSTAYTETQTITKILPSQSITVPPKSCAHVKAIMTDMEITGEVMICVGLSRFEKGNAYITHPKKQHIEYEIDMLSHIAPAAPTPFPYERRLKPISFKELKKGHNAPVELWTTGKYKIESATMSTIRVDITPINSDKIINSYSMEL